MAWRLILCLHCDTHAHEHLMQLLQIQHSSLDFCCCCCCFNPFGFLRNSRLIFQIAWNCFGFQIEVLRMSCSLSQCVCVCSVSFIVFYLLTMFSTTKSSRLLFTVKQTIYFPFDAKDIHSIERNKTKNRQQICIKYIKKKKQQRNEISKTTKQNWMNKFTNDVNESSVKIHSWKRRLDSLENIYCLNKLNFA